MSTDHGFVELPKDLVLENYGFSLDIGGSLAKLVYRAKIDRDFNNNKEQALGRLRLTAFHNYTVNSLIKFVQDNCDIRTDDVYSDVDVTGIGSKRLQEAFKAALNINLALELEFECFFRSASYMYKFNPDGFLIPPSDHVKQASDALAKMVADCLTALRVNEPSGVEQTTTNGDVANSTEHKTTTNNGNSADEAVRDPELYPCLIAMLGSAFGFIEVRKDGSHQFTDGCMKGGRMFLALGKLLTGETDFDKLMELAKNGDPKKVDQLAKDLRDSGATNAYEKFPDEMPVYLLGKLLGDNAVHEPCDILRSLLDLWCVETTQLIHLVCNLHKIKRVYFCGNFVNSEAARDSMSMGMLSRNVGFAHLQKVDFSFISHGGFLGAIGAYMKKYIINNNKQETL